MSPDIARGVLLAAVMEADITVRPQEMDAGRRILSRMRRRENSYSHDEWDVATKRSDEIDQALALLSRADRKTKESIVLDLWEMSICDAELHANEESLVCNFAKRLGVTALPNGMRRLPVNAGY